MKVLIIAAGNNRSDRRLKAYEEWADYIICADGGYDRAKDAGIVPDILVGDFDSLSKEPKDFLRKIRLPCEKDETDTLYALRFAFSKGATEIVLYGGIGDRFDHSYANVCLLQHAMERNIPIVLTDGKTEIYLTDSKLKLEKTPGTVVSVYSFSDCSFGVTLKGLKYPLENAVLSHYQVIGTSNEFLCKAAEFSVEEGTLMIIVNTIE